MAQGQQFVGSRRAVPMRDSESGILFHALVTPEDSDGIGIGATISSSRRISGTNIGQANMGVQYHGARTQHFGPSINGTSMTQHFGPHGKPTNSQLHGNITPPMSLSQYGMGMVASRMLPSRKPLLSTQPPLLNMTSPGHGLRPHTSMSATPDAQYSGGIASASSSSAVPVAHHHVRNRNTANTSNSTSSTKAIVSGRENGEIEIHVRNHDGINIPMMTSRVEKYTNNNNSKTHEIKRHRTSRSPKRKKRGLCYKEKKNHNYSNIRNLNSRNPNANFSRKRLMHTHGRVPRDFGSGRKYSRRKENHVGDSHKDGNHEDSHKDAILGKENREDRSPYHAISRELHRRERDQSPISSSRSSSPACPSSPSNSVPPSSQPNIWNPTHGGSIFHNADDSFLTPNNLSNVSNNLSNGGNAVTSHMTNVTNYTQEDDAILNPEILNPDSRFLDFYEENIKKPYMQVKYEHVRDAVSNGAYSYKHHDQGAYSHDGTIGKPPTCGWNNQEQQQGSSQQLPYEDCHVPHNQSPLPAFSNSAYLASVAGPTFAERVRGSLFHTPPSLGLYGTKDLSAGSRSADCGSRSADCELGISPVGGYCHDEDNGGESLSGGKSHGTTPTHCGKSRESCGTRSVPIPVVVTSGPVPDHVEVDDGSGVQVVYAQEEVVYAQEEETEVVTMEGCGNGNLVERSRGGNVDATDSNGVIRYHSDMTYQDVIRRCTDDSVGVATPVSVRKSYTIVHREEESMLEKSMLEKSMASRSFQKDNKEKSSSIDAIDSISPIVGNPIVGSYDRSEGTQWEWTSNNLAQGPNRDTYCTSNGDGIEDHSISNPTGVNRGRSNGTDNGSADNDERRVTPVECVQPGGGEYLLRSPPIEPTAASYQEQEAPLTIYHDQVQEAWTNSLSGNVSYDHNVIDGNTNTTTTNRSLTRQTSGNAIRNHNVENAIQNLSGSASSAASAASSFEENVQIYAGHGVTVFCTNNNGMEEGKKESESDNCLDCLEKAAESCDKVGGVIGTSDAGGVSQHSGGVSGGAFSNIFTLQVEAFSNVLQGSGSHETSSSEPQSHEPQSEPQSLHISPNGKNFGRSCSLPRIPEDALLDERGMFLVLDVILDVRVCLFCC